MDSDSLRIFCTVATELSVTHAATRLGRAPSNVTTRIQQLEADLGTALFVRSGKRLTLSNSGVQFLDYARRMLALEDEARHVVSDGREGGTLRIGSMESSAASRLPSLLAGYHARHSATRLELSTGASRPLIEQVRTGRLDCAFVAPPPSLGDPSSIEALGLTATPAWRETLLLLLPASEADVGEPRAVRTRSLAAFPQGCTYRGLAEALLGMAGSGEWRVQEMASYHAMIACVAAGSCVTVLPESVLKLERAAAGLKTLPAGHADTVLMWRQGYDVPAFQRLRKQLAESIQ
ncbi:LysR substrate-binding domain-containing protein [Chitinasiproducens palmae]|uniref:DNA-binding transcriptional regulator, LysR family n=1 Tax=Chitinasiproducens palmae TaxID=1770053 RepID=A0A1H2PRK9_9BURK|nr:LysR substrate-binding domain-containing protein [Chitinasiproducens palmae]SDV48722.1 DNA-binding transcriptional regulator, LysR family [Chitinasiproducens palmae]